MLSLIMEHIIPKRSSMNHILRFGISIFKFHLTLGFEIHQIACTLWRFLDDYPKDITIIPTNFLTKSSTGIHLESSMKHFPRCSKSNQSRFNRAIQSIISKVIEDLRLVKRLHD